MDTTNPRDPKPQGCVANMRMEEILEQAKMNPETPGRFNRWQGKGSQAPAKLLEHSEIHFEPRLP